MKYKLGIIGYPLGHSISAVIQKAGFESIGVDAEYDVLETSPENLIDRIKFLKLNGYDGFNVTIPLKVPVSLFVEDLDDYANIAGCINTVKITGEHREMYGYNTDIYGFKTAIPKEVDLRGKNACIIGTGGASRAASVGLIERGISSIDFYTRNLINAQEPVNYLRAKFPNVKFTTHQVQYLQELQKCAIVVNATPVGMKGFAMDSQPIPDEIIKKLDKDTVVYDIVYNPLTTQFLQSAKREGLQVIEGLDMLLYQAQKAIQIWTGKTPDVNVMKIAALRNL